MAEGYLSLLVFSLAVLLGLILLLKSIYSIGPMQVGMVRKRFGPRLPGDNPIALLVERAVLRATPAILPAGPLALQAWRPAPL